MSKAKEADELMQRGNKCLKTTIFKRSSDNLSAAPLFEQAANAYSTSPAHLQEALKAYEAAATAYKSIGTWFKAATLYEKAAALKSPDPQALIYYRAAASIHSDKGDLGKAADALSKGAAAFSKLAVTAPKAQSKDFLTHALTLYEEACQLMQLHDKPIASIEVFRATLLCLVKVKSFGAAIDTIDTMIPMFVAVNQQHNVHKYFLSQTLLALSLNDLVRAEKMFAKVHLQDDGYLHAHECKLAEDLMTFFKNGDAEGLETLVKHPGFHHLDNQVGKLLKQLPKQALFEGAVEITPLNKNNPTSGPSSSATAPVPLTSVDKTAALDDLLDDLDFASGEESDDIHSRGSPDVSTTKRQIPPTHQSSDDEFNLM